LTPVSASNTLSCQRETPNQINPIKNPLDSDHGIYRAGRSKDWIKVKNRKHPAYRRVQDQF
jgi:hypothetical protein